jgi:hypothetical protein
MEILTKIFYDMFASNFQSSCRFFLSDLYSSNDINLTTLDEPFIDSEITEAFSSLNFNASSGPDGFGPGFFKSFWALTKSHVTVIFNQFFSQQTNLESLN